MKPLCIDLYCGLGGWAAGFLAEGYRVIGFDIERHDYGTGTYPGELVLQDVRTLHGSQFGNASVIVASPPCQEYSYRAMPWKRARTLPPPSNELFEACFRIQREASEVAGRYIPMIVENVCGAQKWVGRAAWHFGSYYLWGDVPALMPFPNGRKSQHVPLTETPKGTGSTSWFFGNSKHEGRFYGMKSNSGTHERLQGPNRPRFIREITADCFKGYSKRLGETPWARQFWSSSPARRAASAEIAKIPFRLAQHIARVYR